MTTHEVRTYEVWAPAAATRVEVEVDGARHPLARDGRRDGWWHGEAPAGDYAFRLDGGRPLPDPRSPRQPHGPDGPSRPVDHGAFRWSQTGWRGRPLPGAVLYELHIGTFTAAGTFEAAAEHLDHLVELGVDFVELLPVCPFPGRHGWGYDGVSLWAVHEPYGGPDGLKRFVDAAHRKGLGVVLDVVHNHLGPSGNYLPAFGPYFTDRHHTPWGSAVNLDAPGSDEVRRYLIGSALAWLRDYRIDGLRLDAVHALADDRAVHFLEELSRTVDELAIATNRPLFLVAESDLNSPAPPPRARPAARASPPSGATTSTTRCTPRSPANPRATTATSPERRWPPWPRRSPGASSTTAAGRRSGAAATAAPSRPPTATGCSATCRPTTRSATGHWATGSPRPRPRPARLRGRAGAGLAVHPDAVHG